MRQFSIDARKIESRPCVSNSVARGREMKKWRGWLTHHLAEAWKRRSLWSRNDCKLHTNRSRAAEINWSYWARRQIRLETRKAKSSTRATRTSQVEWSEVILRIKAARPKLDLREAFARFFRMLSALSGKGAGAKVLLKENLRIITPINPIYLHYESKCLLSQQKRRISCAQTQRRAGSKAICLPPSVDWDLFEIFHLNFYSSISVGESSLRVGISAFASRHGYSDCEWWF